MEALHGGPSRNTIQTIERFQLRTSLPEDISFDEPGKHSAHLIRGVSGCGHREDVVEFFEGALSRLWTLVRVMLSYVVKGLTLSQVSQRRS